MASLPEPVVLIIADISGYTRYMTANAKTLSHSQVIITELVKTIVEQVDLPLQVAKLEGDAVFLFGRKSKQTEEWLEKKKMIGERLFTFFETFRAKLSELSDSTVCTCNACRHIEKLRLKVVVHSGEALFHQVLQFQELAGVDVIVVHRLLKNSVKAEEYLLMTEAANRDIELPGGARLVNGVERYDELGEIKTLVYYPQLEQVTLSEQPKEDSFGNRFARRWSLFARLWFRGFKTERATEFRNVTTASTAVGRLAFALLTLLLTPIYLPVGTMLVLLRASKNGKTKSLGHDHEHSPDGACCKRD